MSFHETCHERPKTRPWPGRRALGGWLLAVGCGFMSFTANARPKPTPPPPSSRPLYFSLIDQLPPQGPGPAVNGLEERRRGPIFKDALTQVSRGRRPPRAFILINRDVSLPQTVPGEPPVPVGATLVRIFLTRWSETRLGGVADTEILCRFFVQVVRDGKVSRELGPFLARHQENRVTATLPEERWGEFQAAAREALEKMATALPRTTE